MAYIAPIYARSGYDMNRLVPGMFYGYTDAEKVLDVYMDLVKDYPVFEEELDGVHVVGYNVGTPMHLLLREKPVETLGDPIDWKAAQRGRLQGSARLHTAVYTKPVNTLMGEVFFPSRC